MELLYDTGWAEQPATVEQPLRGDIDCDVVVIGGGGGGMSAALRLAERGVDVVLLEAKTLGWGATSRNAGYLTNSVAADPEVLGLLLKRERLRELYRYAENAVHFAEDALSRHGIDCDYERTGIVMAAVSKGQLRHARRNAKVLAEAGAAGEFIEGPEAGLPEGFLGGIREGVGGTLNPGKFVLGLRDATIAAGVRVYECTPARDVVDTGDGVVVNTPGGKVKSRKALLTTNAASSGLSSAPRHLATPVWTSLVETEPIAPERLDEIGWTSRAPLVTLHMILESYRVTPRGTIAFGTRRIQAGRNPLPDRTPAPNVVDDLVRGFRDRFPGLRDVEPVRAWGGWIGMSSTWLPVAGEASDNVLYSLACNGHGFAQAQYVGHLLAEHVTGAPLHADLAAIWHGRKRFRPSFVSGPALYAGWLADRAADRLAALTTSESRITSSPVG
ncbi:glycine/D-amino acid oxidase-like deaminating enzyme [Nocardia tenerifensis]|uniref:Glycine/D-amino acid oxidase-like deaminating enzyme n=1 Tax=Nocardia tenerifensis TaxID=228006 RepID=A0A318KFR3_9NOCA|nr:FAD-binding oxidoreductase [Nocardia tenerifensis]PXX71669.1 glycine/D-amino acid oxidase-like deaminating enzyme [Nocardia tenerifensis]